MKLIIQATKSDRGLVTEYSLFQPGREDTEIESTLIDERDIPRKAGEKPVLSTQITKSYRVYSLIIGTSDVGGRSGFYSIRLYCPKNLNIKNFESTLFKIKERYFSYASTKTQESQNYNDILSTIVSEENINNFAFLKESENYVCFYDNVTTSLATIFNSKGVHLTKILYAFPIAASRQSSISEFRNFDELIEKLKETEIRGELQLLTEIKVNNQIVEFDNRQKAVTILSYENDRIDYRLHKDGIQAIDPMTSAKIIERKSIPRRSPSPVHTSEVNTSFDRSAGLIVGCFLSFFIGCAVCFVMFSEKIYPFVFSPPESSTTHLNGSNDQRDEFSGLDTITFSSNVKDGKTTFTAVQPSISNYTFRYTDNRWTYKNNNESGGYKEFQSSKLDNFEYQPVNFIEKDQQLLAEALQILFRQEVLPNEKNSDKKDTIKNKQSVNSQTSKKKPGNIKDNGNQASKPKHDSKEKNGEVDVVPKL